MLVWVGQIGLENLCAHQVARSGRQRIDFLGALNQQAGQVLQRSSRT